MTPISWDTYQKQSHSGFRRTITTEMSRECKFARFVKNGKAQTSYSAG